MKKGLLIAALIISLLLGGTYLTAWLTLESHDFSSYKNLGKNYQVTILRDSWGVPHVFGKKDTDVAFGLAWAHSEDDFRTIQGVLHAVRARLAALIGPKGGGNDYMVHLLRHRDYVDSRYEKDIDEKTRALCEAYAAGINCFAAHHPDQVAPTMAPVEGKDIVAGFVHKVPLFFGLDKTLQELFAKQKDEGKKSTQKYDRGGSFLTFTASNTFAVSPKRSREGKTFLAVNSHQPWEGAATWYEAHLKSEEGWEMLGGLFPGSPVILHGHNRNLGWAHTVNRPDLQDLYRLEINPGDPDQYRFDGGWKKLEKREVPITGKIFGAIRWTVKKEVLWSVYGPVVRRPHGTYALRYASMGDITQVMQWYRMNRSSTMKEWLKAMSMQAVPCFNSGYADKKGNILYLYNARLPVRDRSFNWQKELPGNTSKTLWTSYHPFEKLPRVINPASGFIQNCNSTPYQTTRGRDNPQKKNYDATMGIDKKMTNRALRALELYGGDTSISEEEFYRYKFDMYYSKKSDMAKLVRRVSAIPGETDAVIQEGQKLLAAWNLRTDPENRAAALAVLTYMGVKELKKDLKEVKNREILEKLKEAVTLLKKHHRRIDVPWKKVNRLIRGTTDLGMGGGPDILHAVESDHTGDGRLKGKQGDSYILMVTWDRKGDVSSRSIHQYGSATIDSSSPHYGDQAKLFVKRELKPVWLDEQVIRKNLKREYRPGVAAE